MRGSLLWKCLMALAAVATLAGCVGAPTRETLAVTLPGIATVPGSVSVVAGGSERPTLPELKGAIEDSITRTHLFKGVVQGPGGDYELTVFIWNVRNPVVGFNMTVDMEMGWTLVRSSDKAVLLRKTIKTTHTTRAGEAFAGVDRVHMAQAEAARENIREGLKAISDLRLQGF